MQVQQRHLGSGAVQYKCNNLSSTQGPSNTSAKAPPRSYVWRSCLSPGHKRSTNPSATVAPHEPKAVQCTCRSLASNLRLAHVLKQSATRGHPIRVQQCVLKHAAPKTAQQRQHLLEPECNNDRPEPWRIRHRSPQQETATTSATGTSRPKGRPTPVQQHLLEPSSGARA